MHIALIAAIRFEELSQRVLPVIGIHYIRSYLNRYEPDIRVSVLRSPQEVIECKPDLIGISSVTENFNVACRWGEIFREILDVPLIVGGNHISALPHTLPEIFDIGVIGEGEETFRQLSRLIKNGGDWRKRLSRVRGICYHDSIEKRVMVNGERPFIEPMDLIPFPKREKEMWGNFHYMFTSRGCPYNCVFCSPKGTWRRYRSFSPQYVIREMDYILQEFSPACLQFTDDLFIWDRERLKKLRHMIIRRRYHERVVMGGHIRANLIDDEVCRDLVSMGFINGAFGAESGSDRVLRFLKTGSTSVEMNQRAVDICSRYGIRLNLSFVIGTPGEEAEDLLKTAHFIEKNRNKLAAMEVFILLPYPGTPLWRLCKDKGQVSDSMDWDLFRTKAFFEETEIKENFLYINDSMPREIFRVYIDLFKTINSQINRENNKIFDSIEKTVPSPVKNSGNSDIFWQNSK